MQSLCRSCGLPRSYIAILFVALMFCLSALQQVAFRSDLGQLLGTAVLGARSSRRTGRCAFGVANTSQAARFRKNIGPIVIHENRTF